MFVKSRLLISLVLTLSLAGPIGTAQTTSGLTTAAARALTSTDKLEAEILDEASKRADAIFLEIQKQDPSVPVVRMTKVKNQIILRWKQLHALQDVIKVYGSAAKTMVVGEVVTTGLAFILPFFGAGAYSPVLAMPWGVAAGLVVAAYETSKSNLKVARQLDLDSLRSLDKFRQSIVGYDLKKHLTSVLYADLVGAQASGALNIEFVKNSGGKDLSEFPAIQIKELESIILHTDSSGRQNTLDHLTPARASSEDYSKALLLKIIANPKSTNMLNLLGERRRLSYLASNNVKNINLRNEFLALNTLQDKINRSILFVVGEKAKAAKSGGYGLLSTIEAAENREILGYSEEFLKASKAKLTMHEYRLMVKARATESNSSAIDELVKSSAAIRLQLEGALRVKYAVSADIRNEMGSMVTAKKALEEQIKKVALEKAELAKAKSYGLFSTIESNERAAELAAYLKKLQAAEVEFKAHQETTNTDIAKFAGDPLLSGYVIEASTAARARLDTLLNEYKPRKSCAGILKVP